MPDRVRDNRGPLHRALRPLRHTQSDYDALLELVGDRRFVLLGEASHGTYEFYDHWARITQRLITEKGFHAVAVEADWPDAYRVNRYVQGRNEDANANAALSGFKRFPTWMWRNEVVLEFVDWLRKHNDGRVGAPSPTGRDQLEGIVKPGFYGLDLYSLHTSMEAVLAYLDKIDPEAARKARNRYGCFEGFG